jgi:uncharacterized protein YyaL (SSP411 family)
MERHGYPQSRTPIRWRGAVAVVHDPDATAAQTAYVCHEFTCQAPATDEATLATQLEEAASPRRIALS